MARLAIAPSVITRTGVTQPAQTVGQVDGHKIANNGYVVIEVNNIHATLARNVIVQTPGTVDGLAIADLTISVAALAIIMLGPFPPSYYNQVASDLGSIYVDEHAGSETDIKLRVYQISP